MVAFPCALAAAMAAENMDPAGDGSQYAWAENAGWLNAELDTDRDGTPDEGVEVRDFELVGWMWGENLGWVSLSCRNTDSCWVDYGVKNDGHGLLTGFAWAENAGWIDFSPSEGGVAIDPGTGEFHGEAWAENLGWIRFASDGPNPFRVTTSWRCDPPPELPVEPVTLRLSGSGPETWLEWDPVPDATGWDVVVGDMGPLLASAGDFTDSVEACIAENHTSNGLHFPESPPAGNAFWFLVRAVNCGGSGTYDSAGSMQLGSRDDEINTSLVSCN